MLQVLKAATVMPEPIHARSAGLRVPGLQVLKAPLTPWNIHVLLHTS